MDNTLGMLGRLAQMRYDKSRDETLLRARAQLAQQLATELDQFRAERTNRTYGADVYGQAMIPPPIAEKKKVEFPPRIMFPELDFE